MEGVAFFQQAQKDFVTILQHRSLQDRNVVQDIIFKALEVVENAISDQRFDLFPSVFSILLQFVASPYNEGDSRIAKLVTDLLADKNVDSEIREEFFNLGHRIAIILSDFKLNQLDAHQSSWNIPLFSKLALDRQSCLHIKSINHLERLWKCWCSSLITFSSQDLSQLTTIRHLVIPSITAIVETIVSAAQFDNTTSDDSSRRFLQNSTGKSSARFITWIPTCVKLLSKMSVVCGHHESSFFSKKLLDMLSLLCNEIYMNALHKVKLQDDEAAIATISHTVVCFESYIDRCSSAYWLSFDLLRNGMNSYLNELQQINRPWGSFICASNSPVDEHFYRTLEFIILSHLRCIQVLLPSSPQIISAFLSNLDGLCINSKSHHYVMSMILESIVSEGNSCSFLFQWFLSSQFVLTGDAHEAYAAALARPSNSVNAIGNPRSVNEALASDARIDLPNGLSFTKSKKPNASNAALRSILETGVPSNGSKHQLSKILLDRNNPNNNRIDTPTSEAALESATTIIVDRSNRNDSVGSNWRCQELIPGHLELCDAISLLLQIVTFCFDSNTINDLALDSSNLITRSYCLKGIVTFECLVAVMVHTISTSPILDECSADQKRVANLLTSVIDILSSLKPLYHFCLHKLKSQPSLIQTETNMSESHLCAVYSLGRVVAIVGEIDRHAEAIDMVGQFQQAFFQLIEPLIKDFIPEPTNLDRREVMGSSVYDISNSNQLPIFQMLNTWVELYDILSLQLYLRASSYLGNQTLMNCVLPQELLIFLRNIDSNTISQFIIHSCSKLRDFERKLWVDSETCRLTRGSSEQDVPITVWIRYVLILSTARQSEDSDTASVPMSPSLYLEAHCKSLDGLLNSLCRVLVASVISGDQYKSHVMSHLWPHLNDGNYYYDANQIVTIVQLVRYLQNQGKKDNGTNSQVQAAATLSSNSGPDVELSITRNLNIVSDNLILLVDCLLSFWNQWKIIHSKWTAAEESQVKLSSQYHNENNSNTESSTLENSISELTQNVSAINSNDLSRTNRFQLRSTLLYLLKSIISIRCLIGTVLEILDGWVASAKLCCTVRDKLSCINFEVDFTLPLQLLIESSNNNPIQMQVSSNHTVRMLAAEFVSASVSLEVVSKIIMSVTDLKQIEEVYNQAWLHKELAKSSDLNRNNLSEHKSRMIVLVMASVQVISAVYLVQNKMALLLLRDIVTCSLESDPASEDETVLGLVHSALGILKENDVLSHLFSANPDEAIEICITSLFESFVCLDESNPFLWELMNVVFAVFDLHELWSQHFGLVTINYLRCKCMSAALLVMCTNEVTSNNTRKRLISFLKKNNLDLASEHHGILYHVLVSKFLYRMDPSLAIRGSLKDLLLRVNDIMQSGWKCELEFGFANSDIDHVLFDRVSQQTLSPLIWDLGGSTSRRELAEKGLQVLCALEQCRSWKKDPNLNSSDSSEEIIETVHGGSEPWLDNISLSMNKNFLYIMAKLIEFDWVSMTCHQQRQSTRALQRMISYIFDTDLHKFLPKIVVFIEKAIVSPYIAVRLEAVIIVRDLCDRLSDDILEDNTVGFVVLLFNLLSIHEESSGQPTTISNYLKSTKAAVALIGIHKGNGNLVSCDESPVDIICESLLCKDFQSVKLKRMHVIAIDVIIHIIASRRHLPHFLLSVGKIPTLSEFNDIKKAQSLILNENSTEDCIKDFIKLTRHDSNQVRSNVLKLVSSYCHDHRTTLYSMSLYSPTINNVSNDSNKVLLLLRELLTLSSKETSKEILIDCAKCFGEIGAIDPSRISSHIAQFRVHDRIQQFVTVSPWSKSYELFGLHLLENFLVPSLKASSTYQDRIGFAIQAVLKQMAQHSSETEIIRPSNESEVRSEQVPQALHDLLASKKIAHITQPFINTKYLLSAKVMLDPPFYILRISYSRWIGMWTRYLGLQGDGYWKPFFEACGGAVRSHADLSLFLLPYVVLHAISQQSEKKDELFDSIIIEICLVLSGGDYDVFQKYDVRLLKTSISKIPTENNKVKREIDPAGEAQSYEMSVQAIFELLQVITVWITSLTKSVQLNSTSNFNMNDAELTNCLERMKLLLDSIPKPLLGQAAYDIKAYASSLRYFEIHAREISYRSRSAKVGKASLALNHGSMSDGNMPSNKMFSIRNDGSNNELPVLSLRQLDQFMSIYSELDDIRSTDALQGFLVLRQILGFPTSSWCNIMEFEQKENWSQALNEYGLAHSAFIEKWNSRFEKFRSKIIAAGDDSCRATTSNKRKLPLTEEDENSRAAPLSNKKISLNYSSSLAPTTPSLLPLGQVKKAATNLSTTRGSKRKINSPFGSETEVDDVSQELIKEFSRIEKGRLQCLIQLEHLDTVVSQSTEVSKKFPDLEAALLPLGMEASWRLMNWDHLESFSEISENVIGKQIAGGGISPVNASIAPESMFQIRVGRLFLALHKQDNVAFCDELNNCRQEMMRSLAAACKESYDRSFPYVGRLQILSEIEDGFRLINEPIIENRTALLKTLEWSKRLEMLETTYLPLTMSLAVRRTLLAMSGMHDLVAQNWLELSRTMRKMGRFDAARLALRRASSIGLGRGNDELVLLEECHILKGEGEINKALMLLEPVEINPFEAKEALHQYSLHVQENNTKSTGVSSRSKTTITNPALYEVMADRKRRHQFADRMHLATQLMVQNRQKHGKGVIERYSLILKIHKENDVVQYELGRYYESLYNETKEKRFNDENVFGFTDKTTHVLSASAESQKGLASAVLGSTSASGISAEESNFFMFSALKSYIICLKNNNSIMITQALPRMLTLWFSYMTPNSISAKQRNAQQSNPAKNKHDVNVLMNECCEQSYISEYTWFHCMPQLVSRLGHQNLKTVQTIERILKKILICFPQQGVWHIAGLLHSLNDGRVLIGRNLISDASVQLRSQSRTDEADMLKNAKKLFEELVGLAKHSSKERRIKCEIGVGMTLNHFLVPSQKTLMTVPLLQTIQYVNNKESVNYFQSDQLFIKQFHDTAEVAQSKARPKIIMLTTTSGQNVKFLLKQEKNGDLRKDARMMEFNTVVNRILVDDPEGRKRNLRLKTYAVVCLNEECGLLEWVNNTQCLRAVIIESHSFYKNNEYPLLNPKDVIETFPAIQQTYEGDLEMMVKEYRVLILNQFKPCLHRWFLEKFPDPTQWLEARTLFTRSAAVWATVGHVIGLGDRHTENVLLDVQSGECVHVDFDCLFDKGLTLQRPEIVPFRLTPNIVDAMGVSGIEGIFRCTMEVCMSLLRQNKDTLLSVLEPFLRDPTVAWGRQGRAQRGNESSTISKAPVGFSVQDKENSDAKEALLKISGRLNGVYNITHPAADKIKKAYAQRNSAPPNKGIGASKDEELPLSVPGQVQRLISEAIMEENLAQMFIGWQPWM